MVIASCIDFCSMSNAILSLGLTKLDYWGRLDINPYVHLPAVSEPVYAKGTYMSLMDCHYIHN